MKRSAVRVHLAILTITAAFCVGGSALAQDCGAPRLLNSLPMERMPGSDVMTVTATIDGRPAKLQVGLGDLSTQLWMAQAAKLHLPVREGPRTMDAGGRFSEDVARVESLRLGSMETGNFDARILSDPDFRDAGSDGVLGTNMMQRYDIDLDFARGRLNYFSPEGCEGAGVYWAPRKVTSVRMAAYGGVVYVPVTLDGHTIIALLDTDADRTFLNPELADRLFGLKAASLQPGTVTDGAARIKAGMHRFSSLTLGGLTFDNPQIAIPFDVLSQNTREFNARRTARNVYHLSEYLPDMLIGMDVLKQTHLYVAFRDRRIYVSAAGDGHALEPQPVETSWFNVWKYGYDTYRPYRRPFVKF